MEDKTLTIGLDAKRLVRNATGLGNYGRSLVSDLADMQLSLRLYAPDAGRENLRQRLPQGDNVSLCFPPETTGLAHLCPDGIRKALWRSHGIIRQLVADRVQVFHGLSGELPIGIRQTGISSVVTIHDLIFMRHPEYYHWWDRLIYEWKFQRALREADRIIAISECTRRDIAELGGTDASRIDLIYQTCQPRYSQPLPCNRLKAVAGRLQLPRHFMLNVGSIEERKNVLLAVFALPFLPETLHLVVAGKPTPYVRLITETAQRMGLAHRVHLFHGLDDDALHALYQLADVFVYPSRYEGFGIPIIEAIQSGLPVVACTGSCLEEAGGPDSLYVEPDDVEALAHAVRRVLPGADERTGRIIRSRDYVRRFEGGSVAAQVADIYRSLCN